MASDGIINFTGVITANTCTVKLDDNSSGTGTVTLPRITASALPSSGSVAGITAFKINLTDCTIADKPLVSAYFEPSANVNTAGRLLQTSSGGAANVEIELLNAEYGVIDAHAASGSQNSTMVPMVIGDTSATLAYFAQYYATGAVSAGALTSQISYTVVYD